MEVSVYDSVNAAPLYGDPALQGDHLPRVIVIYSDDQSVRAAVSGALGKVLPGETLEHKVVEFATADALRLYLSEKRRADLFILDGPCAQGRIDRLPTNHGDYPTAPRQLAGQMVGGRGRHFPSDRPIYSGF